MDVAEIKAIIESMLFVSDTPLRLETLVTILPETNKETILEESVKSRPTMRIHRRASSSLRWRADISSEPNPSGRNGRTV